VILGPLKLFLKLASYVVGAIVLYFAFGFLQIWMTSHERSVLPAQAILVFGTTENNGTPSPELKARLDQALLLYRHHRAPWIVVTGGKLAGDTHTEAGVSATYLEAHGVPAAQIIRGGGNDTWQNVTSVIDQMHQHNLTIVLTVTDPFHEYRAMAIASDQGLTPLPAPVGNSKATHSFLWWYYLRETFAVGVGRLVGYHTLSQWTSGATTITLPPSQATTTTTTPGAG